MDELDKALGHVGDDRRAFLKKLVIGTAFAVPVVSSFTMSGIQAAYAQTAATSAGVKGGGASTNSSTSGGTTSTAPEIPQSPTVSVPNPNPNVNLGTTVTTNPNQTRSDVNLKDNIVPVVW